MAARGRGLGRGGVPPSAPERKRASEDTQANRRQPQTEYEPHKKAGAARRELPAAVGRFGPGITG